MNVSFTLFLPHKHIELRYEEAQNAFFLYTLMPHAHLMSKV